MKVAIYMTPPILGGAELRTLEVTSRFPKDRYVVLVPRNLKERALEDARRLGLREELIKVLREAYELDDYTCRSPLCSIGYRRRAEKVAERLGVDLIYAPVDPPRADHFVGHSMSPVRWVRLLQSSLPVGSLVTEDGSGLRLFLKVAKVNGIGTMTALRHYARLWLINYATFDMEARRSQRPSLMSSIRWA